MIDCTLSSLDAKVSKKVMDRAVNGLCRDKLVLFVTHDLDHAAQMDQVICLSDCPSASVEIMQAADLENRIDSLKGKIGKTVEPDPVEAAPGEDPTALLNRTLSCSDAYSTTSREVAQVIVDEENQAGRVSYSDLAEYFSYSFGGMWGVVIVFLAHIFINGCSLAVSLYLAFSLT